MMLEFKQVNTFYGRVQALHDVSLSVRKGEIVTLIGANGAGKSTLLMTLCGIAIKVLKWTWLEQYAMPVCMLGAMALSIPITAMMA